MSDIYVVLHRPDDEVKVLIIEHNGERMEIASANHDEHGWAGMSILDDVARELAAYLGTYVRDEEGEDYEY